MESLPTELCVQILNDCANISPQTLISAVRSCKLFYAIYKSNEISYLQAVTRHPCLGNGSGTLSAHGLALGSPDGEEEDYDYGSAPLKSITPERHVEVLEHFRNPELPSNIAQLRRGLAARRKAECLALFCVDKVAEGISAFTVPNGTHPKNKSYPADQRNHVVESWKQIRRGERNVPKLPRDFADLREWIFACYRFLFNCLCKVPSPAPRTIPFHTATSPDRPMENFHSLHIFKQHLLQLFLSKEIYDLVRRNRPLIENLLSRIESTAYRKRAISINGVGDLGRYDENRFEPDQLPFSVVGGTDEHFAHSITHTLLWWPWDGYTKTTSSVAHIMESWNTAVWFGCRREKNDKQVKERLLFWIGKVYGSKTVKRIRTVWTRQHSEGIASEVTYNGYGYEDEIISYWEGLLLYPELEKL